jgi:hypothetical protein
MSGRTDPRSPSGSWGSSVAFKIGIIEARGDVGRDPPRFGPVENERDPRQLGDVRRNASGSIDVIAGARRAFTARPKRGTDLRAP